MTARNLLKAAEKFVIDNSPGILTGLGVAGTVTTAILAGKATITADRILEAHVALNRDPDGMLATEHKLTNTEIVKIVWKEYVPAAIALSATVASIIMANQIGTRRAAAITAAFQLSEKMSKEYREKVVEALGKNGEEKVRTELAAERMEKSPGRETIIISGTEAVFFDEWSGRYFKAEMETVRKAVNEINHQINTNYFASLTDFYDRIGLDRTEMSDDFGWNTDELLDVSYNAVLMSDGRPAIGITYNKHPIRGYDRCQ